MTTEVIRAQAGRISLYFVGRKMPHPYMCHVLIPDKQIGFLWFMIGMFRESQPVDPRGRQQNQNI
jgi:hypothetical protein